MATIDGSSLELPLTIRKPGLFYEIQHQINLWMRDSLPACLLPHSKAIAELQIQVEDLRKRLITAVELIRDLSDATGRAIR